MADDPNKGKERATTAKQQPLWQTAQAREKREVGGKTKEHQFQ